MSDQNLTRLRPFEGLCLTADDLLDEQAYHRANNHRHNLFMHGHGIVQGLQVELGQARKKYSAVIEAGFGVTQMGQGVLLSDAAKVPLEAPRKRRVHALAVSRRGTTRGRRSPVSTPARTGASRVWVVAPRLHPIDEPSGCRRAVSDQRPSGRMVQVLSSAALRRQSRAASYPKPRVIEFIRVNKGVVQNLLDCLLKSWTSAYRPSIGARLQRVSPD